MSVSGSILFNKIQGLRQELCDIITPDLLDKVCEEPSVQPFLQWFCKNINVFNILSNEEVQMLNKIKIENEWLEGPELEMALEKAAKDCPDLLKIPTFNETDINDLYAEYEILKDLYKEDENYIETLKNGIINLKKLETKFDEDIEEQHECLDKEFIEVDRAYRECSSLIKDFDIRNHEFFKEIETLLNSYTDAARNIGPPLLWTQIPLNLFTKKIELYNHYLDVHIKRQFDNAQKEEQNIDSNYVSLINNSKEKRMDHEKLQELSLCKINIINAKIEEVLAKAREESHATMFNYVQDIYNFGFPKIPTYSELRTEISKLTRKRDILEQNVSLLQDQQLTEVVQQFSEFEISKILKQDAQARLERTSNHLEKLKNLLFFAREHGHVHTDLLRMLMEMQFHRLKEVREFIADARHYLTTEYTLSSTRCESMHRQQNEYSQAVSSSQKVHNSFHKHFISMICGGGNSQLLNFALDKYNELINDNKHKRQYILETYLKSKIGKLEVMESETNSQYINELRKVPTHMFKPVSYDIETCYNEAFDISQKVQSDLTKIRNQIKERLKMSITMEKERNILWQRFLVDPDTLRQTFKELVQASNKSCFGHTSSNE